MKFLRNLLASCLGTSIAILLLIFIGSWFIGIMVAALNEEEQVTVSNNTVLELDLSTPIRDYAPLSDNPFDALVGETKLQLSAILNAIENAKYDDNIQGISISNFVVNAGFAQVQAIRTKLEEFKESGKFITAHADLYSQKNYYLSSIADSIYVTPFGSVEFRGLSTERLFYKDFQDKYGVKMEVIRHGKYKSAVEGYLDNKMSDENREQITSLLMSIWNEILEDVSINRSISIEQLNLIADNLLTKTSELALENGMIDRLIYKDQYQEILKELTGSSSLETVDISDYIATGKGRLRASSSSKIALLYAQGTILYGEGNETYIGQNSMIKAIQKIKRDSSIEAVVVRVNSPGGVALTADLISRELDLLQEEKPVVISMGNMATSGGYWIAANADKIYAEPMTITGSIGVFGTLPNVSGLVNEIGINAEQVSTNRQSNMYSLYEPISQEFYEERKVGIEKVYTTFLQRVSKGRNMTIDEVDAIAQGRVWSGIEAQEIGLVDELGGLEQAIEEAASLAGLSDYWIMEYPSYQKSLQDSFKNFPFVFSKHILKEELGKENYKIYEEIKQFSTFNGIQAILPYAIEIN